ncbi:hypothetical protein HPP92_018155 [Vanilla planifolia]|uniref:Uncharacterized protein n=1 Tax=Vanilla planifolia TaxID=51239 RepID=A0A835QAF8_VANPL|nr:hypothetical protein HPP92_018741 [Vanilla planifolia]KAG0468827.1 hypothetical protein HPP92_018155 [Vanilla planifolia]
MTTEPPAMGNSSWRNDRQRSSIYLQWEQPPQVTVAVTSSINRPGRHGVAGRRTSPPFRHRLQQLGGAEVDKTFHIFLHLLVVWKFRLHTEKTVTASTGGVNRVVAMLERMV